MLLDWLSRRAGRNDLREAAAAIENTVHLTLGNPSNCTPDQGGTATTSDYTRTVIQNCK